MNAKTPEKWRKWERTEFVSHQKQWDEIIADLDAKTKECEELKRRLAYKWEKWPS